MSNANLRVMALDLGAARIGVALSDRSGILASPHLVLARNPDDDHTIKEILDIATTEEVGSIVVGVPKSLQETVQFAENAVMNFINALRDSTDLPVVGVDERFTTVIATHRLREMGLNSRTMKEKIDAVAAAEILQSYLDNRVK